MMNPMMMMGQMMMGAAMMSQMMGGMGGCCSGCGGSNGCGDMSACGGCGPDLNAIQAGFMPPQAPEAEEEEEEEEIPAGVSHNVNHPNYRPPDMDHVPGVTDKRFTGKIKFWFENKGFGFIESHEFKKVFGGDSDVFLHHFQKHTHQRGDLVSFSVFTNFRGKPQGTELRKIKE
eukprot:TRINITY_DN8771_c0_g2_i1.p1 TRINITY_DN8771_c0_g2~~TRINITY_DN8771_c0_g2_i1.p1  ORF type:complete len:174 (-),score=35.64 TRINITY_DN8771_c0_g2_i1:784-1305(-)